MHTQPFEVQIIKAEDLKMSDVIYVTHGFYGYSEFHTEFRNIVKMEWTKGEILGQDDQLMVALEQNDGEPAQLHKFFYAWSLVMIQKRSV